MTLNLKAALMKNTSVQILHQIISIGTGLVIHLTLSRYLDVARFGQFNYVFAFFFFLLSLNDFGINTIVVREISQRRNEAAQIVGTVLTFKCGFAFISMITAWILINSLNFSDPLRSALLLYAFILPLITLQSPGVIFQVLLKLEYLSLIGILNRLLSLALVLVCVANGYGLVRIVACLLVPELLSLGLIFLFSRRYVLPKLGFDRAILGKILRPSVPPGLAGIFGAIINRVDFLMLERMTDPEQLGLYSAAYRVITILESFPAMIMATVYPVMSRYAHESRVKLKHLYRKIFTWLSLIAVVMGLGVNLFSKPIIVLLFGNPFEKAAQALAILIWASVFLYMALSGGHLLVSLGKEKIGLSVQASAAVLNIILNLYWFPTMGYVGASLATAASFLWILIATVASVEICLKK